jgi:predicted transcriptional regulator
LIPDSIAIDANDLITLTADIVSAHVSHNNIAVGELPALIASVHSALTTVNEPIAPEPVKQEPAVSIRSSVKPDYIVCLEDGKKLKMLKRHLRTTFDMSPDEYRAKWGLPKDYPMVAPNYSDARKALALTIGLGRKAGTKVAKAAAPAKSAKAPVKRAKLKVAVAQA